MIKTLRIAAVALVVCLAGGMVAQAGTTSVAGKPVTLQVGAAIASAGTIAVLAPVTHITGTTNVVTITPPPGCASGTNGCQITLIPDGLWSTTNAGNIAIATTGVVSKALILTWDNATTKWYPSY